MLRHFASGSITLGLSLGLACAEPVEPGGEPCPDEPTEYSDVAERAAEIAPELWGWDAGVAMTGLVSTPVCWEDDAHLDAAKAWYDLLIGMPIQWDHVNQLAPGFALVELGRHYPEGPYLDEAIAIADLFLDLYPTLDGAMVHRDDELWADTTFMSAPFLAELGRETGDERYTDVAVTQVLVHAEYLQHDSGLWFHGWDELANQAGETPTNGVLWARGNGWGAAAAVQVYERLEAGDPARAEIEAVLVPQLEALMEVQADDGGWHTVLDDESTYTESAATGLIAYALIRANQLGLVGDSASDAAERGRELLRERVAGDGSLLGVSGPTVVSTDADYYATRPVDEPRAYAQGVYLLAAGV